MRITDKYILFWTGEFSNFWPCRIDYDSYRFRWSEQLFMYLKAKHYQDAEMCKQILNASSPREAKRLGRTVRGFNTEDWNKYKRDFMYEAVYEKFTQNSELGVKLLAPKLKGKHFVEASPYDRIWGIGLHEEDVDANDELKWKGQNLLGKTLDRVRQKLIQNEQ